MSLTLRKKDIKNHFDSLARSRNFWIEKNNYFYQEDKKYIQFLVGSGKRVLELGCGTGQLLNALDTSYGVGVDFSEETIKIAKKDYPHLKFIQGDLESVKCISAIEGEFDFIILADTIGYLDDCEEVFSNLHHFCNHETRIIVSYHSWRWEPILSLGEKIGLRMPSVEMNWLSTEDTMGLLHLADFEPVKREWRQLIPYNLFGLGFIFNKIIGTLPIIRRLCLRNYIVARPIKEAKLTNPSATVLIPCRNEKGNIEKAITRLPKFCSDMEILYVEGGSSDGTLAEGLGLNVAWYNMLFIVAFVTLLTAAPISIAGWGVREGIMVVGLGYLGVIPEQALVLSILYGVLMLVSSLPGLIIWYISDYSTDDK